MTAIDFALSIIEGDGGMKDFEATAEVRWEHGIRTEAALWTLKCLANPKCEGSADMLHEILHNYIVAEGE